MVHQIENQNVSGAPAYVKFSSLPKEIQARLLARQSGQGEGLAIKTAGISASFFLIPAALVWLAALFFLTNDYLWSNFQTVIFALASLAAVYLLLDNLYKLIQWFISRSKGYLLLTPRYLIEMRFNDVWYWDLDQLAAANSHHSFQQGRYRSTQITFSLENGQTKTFPITGLERAEEIIDQVYLYKKLFAEAAAKNDAVYLDANDDFIELKDQPRRSKTAPGVNLRRALTAAAAIALTGGVMFGAAALNNYYDDLKSWRDAESANRAYLYRTYLQAHPQGRWTGDARQSLRSLYEAAERKYLAALNQGADKQAADAVVQILRYAKETQNYRIKTVFERHNEISPDIAEELKKEFEVKKILSLGDTFSDEKMGRRESSLSSVVANAFREVIPDDILDFSGECPAECVTLAVKYRIGSKSSLYFDMRQKDIPEDDRTFYPGIYIDWDFGIRIPGQPQSYNFELKSNPSSEITYDSNPDSKEVSPDNEDFSKSLDADKNYIYDSMVSSAFENFKANLVYRMGIGEEPVKKTEQDDEEEPAKDKKDKNNKKTMPLNTKPVTKKTSG